MNKNMNQPKAKKQSFLHSRKFKYGSAAAVFTAFFIAAVILLNVIVSAIDSKFSLYFDLTADEIFSISQASEDSVRQMIDEYKEEQNASPEIRFTFFQARDILMGDEMRSWVINLAESYAEKFPEITVEFKEDLKTHPENYTYYTELGHTIDGNSILVSNSLEKGSFRLLSFDACLVYTEDGSKVWAFQGEMKFNATIMYITAQKNPVVSFITGHGESVPESLVDVLTNCGFSIENVDLTKENISDETKVLFLCNPQKDLTYSEDDSVETEYTKLSKYLNDYRSLVVIGSPSMPQLPVLDELMASWGLELVRNQIVMDDVASHTTDNRMLYVDYVPSTSVAAALTGSLTGLSSPPRSISHLSAPINILFTGDGNSNGVEAVLTSSQHSYVEVKTEQGTEKQNGPFNLMAISTRFTIVNNVNTYGHLLLIGSQHFTETNTYREQFGNTDIVYNMIRLLSNENVPTETNYKVLEDYAIDMDSGEVYVYGIVTAAVIPIIVFAMGITVYIKRKHM